MRVPLWPSPPPAPVRWHSAGGPQRAGERGGQTAPHLADGRRARCAGMPSVYGTPRYCGAGEFQRRRPEVGGEVPLVRGADTGAQERIGPKKPSTLRDMIHPPSPIPHPHTPKYQNPFLPARGVVSRVLGRVCGIREESQEQAIQESPKQDPVKHRHWLLPRIIRVFIIYHDTLRRHITAEVKDTNDIVMRDLTGIGAMKWPENVPIVVCPLPHGPAAFLVVLSPTAPCQYERTWQTFSTLLQKFRKPKRKATAACMIDILWLMPCETLCSSSQCCIHGINAMAGVLLLTFAPL